MLNILYITPSDINDLKNKGVISLIKERNEDGYFNKVITLIPFARSNEYYEINKNNILYQYGWKSKINFLNNFLIIKILKTITIIYKLIFIFPFIIKKEKISIIRATNPYYMGLIGLYYSKLLNIPVVVSIHSDYDIGEKLGGQTFKILGSRKLAKKLENFIYLKCNHILPIRKYLKQQLINQNKNITIDKIKIFPHGIDFQGFNNCSYIDIYKYFNINVNKKIISFIGRLSKENYIYKVIEIAKKLKDIRDDFIFLILGNGNEFKNIINIINMKNLKDVINIVGFQNKNIVINTRKQSHISLSLMGGFSLIGACAGVRPVISYDVEWHYELVVNNKTGYLIEENNINKIIEKINYLFDNPNKAILLGKNAYDLAFKNHDIKKTTKIKQNIYTGILNEYYKG